MNLIGKKINQIIHDRSLMRRIGFIIGILFVSRLLAAIPIPGVDAVSLQQFFASNQFFGVLNVLSGSGLSTLSIVMLGVGPYITASIIMQLLTVMIPKVKALQTEEGERGRLKFAQYARILTIPLAIIQGFSLLVVLERQGVIGSLSSIEYVTNLSVIVGGAVLMMWLGELLSEFGIGNGLSLLIVAGIVASLPQQISQLLFTYDPSQLPTYIAFAIFSILMIAGIVFVTEAERPIQVQYARQVRGTTVTGGTSTYLPIRLNQAGVMPIIFAMSLLLFPQLLANFLGTSANETLQSIARSLVLFLQNELWYGIVYFILIFVFTYFYTAVTFDPKQIATNLQKNGAFIPGIRPGESTIAFLSGILSRTTFFGALFLGVVAVIPLVIQSITGINQIAIGGTALLIVVAVFLDILKRVDAQLAIQDY